MPIVDGLIAFLHLNLDAMDEFIWNEDFSDPPDPPYIERFPPDFSAECEAEYEAAQEQCMEHFAFLQSPFFCLVTFCFDQDFYPDELSDLTAYQRLYVYAKIPNANVPQEIRQLCLFNEAVLEGFKEIEKAIPRAQKAGTIKPDAFDKWNRQACTMRDGKGDATAFEQWCHESFPNRARKGGSE